MFSPLLTLYPSLLSFPLFTSSARAINHPTAVEVLIKSTNTILQPRIEISLPPVIIPSITIPEFKYTSKFSLKSLDLHLPTPTCDQTITSDKNGHVPPGTCHALWDYYPSFVAAVVAASIFGTITLVRVGEAIYFKTAYCWVICVGLLWECIGFIFRALNSHFPG
ncbi:hypothetical protein BKA61DRAFT_577665 [Leptodontidium sp. MPI-SDFR-AT-0119]|nr:hypothetical protein BKA61DRAFT_577665 [Leptodontidium sp. MPI-SDFR-AT-0119]